MAVREDALQVLWQSRGHLGDRAASLSSGLTLSEDAFKMRQAVKEWAEGYSALASSSASYRRIYGTNSDTPLSIVSSPTRKVLTSASRVIVKPSLLMPQQAGKQNDRLQAPIELHDKYSSQLKSFSCQILDSPVIPDRAIKQPVVGRTPPTKKKAPPPQKKKAPPSQITTSRFRPQPEQDPFIPTPPSTLKARRVHWVPLSAEKLVGTIWDGLLEEEHQWPRADTVFDSLEVDSHGCQHRSSAALKELSPGQLTEVDSAKRRRSSIATDVSLQNGLTLTFVASRFEPNYSAALELFFEDEDIIHAKKARQAARLAMQPPPKGILDSRKVHNLEIALKGLGIYQDWQSLRYTILEMDLGIPETEGYVSRQSTPVPRFDVANCAVLTGFLPSVMEEELLRKAPLEKLTKAETIVLEWLKIPRFRQRLDCCVTLLGYRTAVEQLRIRQSRQRDVIETLDRMTSTPPAIKALLGVCLRIGNYLNFYTNKKAKGFALSSLDSFKRVTSVDGSTNLLKFIAETLDSQFPSIWLPLREGLQNCAECAQLDPQERRTQIEDLENSVRKVRLEVTDFNLEHDGRFLEIMTKFVNTSAKMLDQMRNENEQTIGLLLQRSKYFDTSVENVQDALEVIKKLGLFWADLLKARNENQAKTVKQTPQKLQRSRGKTSLTSSTPLHDLREH